MLSLGIIGLPNVGKSTLFKALTNVAVDIQNYPFTTIDPNIGTVKVPDQRVDALAIMSASKKKIYATVDFTDIAGLVKGAAQGEGLGNKFLANIRETDAIAQVVRAFDDKNITHVHDRINPAEDIEIINTELIFADLETVQKRIQKSEKESKSPTLEGKKATADLIILAKFKEWLDSGKITSSMELNEDEKLLAKELGMLTAKKFIYVINVSEDQLINRWQPDEKLLKVIKDSEYIVMNNKLELTLSEVTSEEKAEYLKEFNLPESGLDSLIKTSYKILGLLTFLTTGEDETRAWTANIGDPIPRASRAIHTDFEKLFIRGEVVNWKSLLDSGSWSLARGKGLIKTVGRDYIIQEGDVVEILIGK
jgi:GTP-binding protein YchF